MFAAMYLQVSPPPPLHASPLGWGFWGQGKPTDPRVTWVGGGARQHRRSLSSSWGRQLGRPRLTKRNKRQASKPRLPTPSPSATPPKFPLKAKERRRERERQMRTMQERVEAPPSTLPSSRSLGVGLQTMDRAAEREASQRAEKATKAQKRVEARARELMEAQAAREARTPPPPLPLALIGRRPAHPLPPSLSP
jgi:hypothetical protein